MTVIDAHCHAGQGDGYTGPWDTWAPLGPHLRRSAAAGIGLTIVFPVFNSSYAEPNRRLAAIVAASHGRLLGYGGVHPVAEAGRVDALVDEAIGTLGLRGLKVHGHDALPTDEVMLAAARHGIPVLVDVVRRVDEAATLARRHPSVPIVVAHLGGFADDWHGQRRLTDLLAEYPNLHADTSGVRYWDVLERAARLAPDRLIFGSDGPFLHPGVELEKIRLLPVRPDVRRAIAGGTVARLLGLVEAAGVAGGGGRLASKAPRPSPASA